jgi:quercetin dioxygenase-like cupin family protein
MGTVHRRQPDGSWQDVPTRPYGMHIRRHELIGPADGAPHFRVRYFEVPPGDSTTVERHEHDHGVLIQQGRARVTLGNDTHDLGPGDVVYVEPNELHSFEAVGDETLGFICVAPPT